MLAFNLWQSTLACGTDLMVPLTIHLLKGGGRESLKGIKQVAQRFDKWNCVWMTDVCSSCSMPRSPSDAVAHRVASSTDFCFSPSWLQQRTGWPGSLDCPELQPTPPPTPHTHGTSRVNSHFSSKINQAVMPMTGSDANDWNRQHGSPNARCTPYPILNMACSGATVIRTQKCLCINPFTT